MTNIKQSKLGLVVLQNRFNRFWRSQTFLILNTPLAKQVQNLLIFADIERQTFN